MARLANLSRATVSALTDELIAEGFVISSGTGESGTTGRKPTIIKINGERGQIITVGLKKNRAEYTLFDFALKEIERFSFPMEYSHGFAERLISAIWGMSEKIDQSKLIGFCVAVPATILSDTQELLSTVLDIEPGYNILEELPKLLPEIPVFFANNSSMMAYAEMCFEGIPDIKNLIYVNIRQGVGAGIIMDGKLFKGAHGRAGEFGHMSLDLNGPQCSCGRRGCVERLLNEPAILQTFKEAMYGGAGNGQSIDYNIIRTALEDQDPKALAAASEIVGKLSQAISNLVCLFNPEHIVIGGGIQKLGDTFFDLLNESIVAAASCGTKWTRKLSLKYSKLGDNLENIGIAKYFLDQLFTLSSPISGHLYLC